MVITNIEETSFGVKEIDKIFGKNLPKGFTFLVVGLPGSGKEVLTKQFAGAKNKNESCIYFSANEREDEIISFIENHHWSSDLKVIDLGQVYYEDILSRTLRLAKEIKEMSAKKITRIASEGEDKSYEEEEINFVNLTWANFTDMKKPCRSVFDCIEFIVDYHSEADAIKLVQAVKTYTQNTDGTSFFCLTKDLYPKLQLRMESIVDCVIELDTYRRIDELEKLVILKKVKNLQPKMSINRYKISDEGFQYDTMKRVV
jgi:KaiC/GvpD/RAD55 family RecA-like ATPase